MTSQEFLDQFDVWFNNIASNAAPGITPYEVSVFLTKALDIVVKSYFADFDKNQKRQIDFSTIIRQIELAPQEASQKYDDRAYIYHVPNDVFLIVNESILDCVVYNKRIMERHGIYQVVPITYDTYSSLMTRAYKYPHKSSAWRLITSKVTLKDNQYIQHEVIGKFHDTPYYKIRYVKTLKPIIVANLNNQSIEGYSTITECELPLELHTEVLDTAILLAKQTFGLIFNSSNNNKSEE